MTEIYSDVAPEPAVDQRIHLTGWTMLRP